MMKVLKNIFTLFTWNVFYVIGFYECIGSNTAGEDIKTAQLIYAGIMIIFLFNIVWIYIFTEPPIVSTDNAHVLVSPGDNVDLTCRVTGETFPDIRWFRGNEPVRSDTL
jgi:hypothetical protein